MKQYDLNYCKVCNSMTNHLVGVCQRCETCLRCGTRRSDHPRAFGKCKEFVSGERIIKDYDPIFPFTCGKCGRKLSPWINPKTGKQEEYSWYCYKCKGKAVLSIG